MSDAEPRDWAAIKAPSLGDIEQLAETASARLPTAFRRLCEGVVIRVADLPEDEVLDELDIESPFDLLGLFRGVGLAQGGGGATVVTILCDAGQRYASKLYNPEFLRAKNLPVPDWLED